MIWPVDMRLPTRGILSIPLLEGDVTFAVSSTLTRRLETVVLRVDLDKWLPVFSLETEYNYRSAAFTHDLP